MIKVVSLVVISMSFLEPDSCLEWSKAEEEAKRLLRGGFKNSSDVIK